MDYHPKGCKESGMTEQASKTSPVCSATRGTGMQEAWRPRDPSLSSVKTWSIKEVRAAWRRGPPGGSGVEGQ